MSVIKLYRPFIIFAISILLTLSISRFILILWKFERVSDSQGFNFILLQGLRFDLILIGLIIIIPAICAPLASINKYSSIIFNKLINIYFVISFSCIIFIELSTPSFINQYDLRPNYLYIEYLKYPKEIISTLWSAYKLPLFISISLTLILSYTLHCNLRKNRYINIKISFIHSLLLMPVALLVCVLLIRSTFDHRPVNPAIAAFSSDPLMNSLSLSSGYSVLYAIYEKRYEDSVRFPYGFMSSDKATQIVKNSMQVSSDDFINSRIPTLHNQRAYIRRKKPKNLVIILEESLGAEYVGALGGRKITPELDKLSQQGIWFNNLYATGTRSVRGIEAVITGFLPTPSRSIVKLRKSQTNFFTIGQLLKSLNYKTSFIYGGESHFDNMKRFFANNGFSKIIDENDYVNPVFYGSWGVSDEDLFARANEEFLNYENDQPFFSLVFTSSNHPPFDFPDNRIKTGTLDKNTVNNAVKYADYALGQYIAKARKSSYWKNTLFLIVADHSDKVYGSEIVPIKHFKIPALILGSDIQPINYTQVASQIDLLPTLLSLMGIDSSHPAIGHDLSQSILTGRSLQKGRAIMQFAGSQAYMEGTHVVTMEKGKNIKEHSYKNKKLITLDVIDNSFREKALAHVIWASNAYTNTEYRLASTIKNNEK